MPSALVEGIKYRENHIILLLSFIIVYAFTGCSYAEKLQLIKIQYRDITGVTQWNIQKNQKF